MEKEKVAAEKKRKKRKGKSGRIVIVFIVVLAALLGGFFLYKKKTSSQKSQGDQSVSTATVKRTDISSELTASSSLSPKDTYEVTSLVEGEVIEANFEEGDVVEKGQILYRIDASSMDSDLSSAETSLQRAKESAQTAQSDYAEEIARRGIESRRAAKEVGQQAQQYDSFYLKTKQDKMGHIFTKIKV